MESIWRISVQDKRVRQLMKKDDVMARLIKEIGDIERTLRPYPLKSLVRSIVGQQISVKAAETIFERLSSKINHQWSVEALSELSVEELTDVGLSRPKQRYLDNLLEHIDLKEVDLNALHDLSNAEIINQLTAVKGIGQWTVEMFLIFTLQREDVVPLDDVGLQRAAQHLYQAQQVQGKAVLKACKEKWGAQGTIGCLYLWEYIHQYHI
ncbi:DNA-3-methyladenine glycosylase 2 family protein [Staphylococcus sp. SQ8-PEA]|uniref:DNA-3-methyladenine glycosylase II n=1 Tax=Staphylococcus marylandisciuri TaxID=2981529 RepID=A0ABT2QSI2_9STAP|nr:DNA-3-methyladenine glycosylase 2 family protein [Staphylococcus marylandisciuri]MCU5746941.1 DNA-3-methyladenine glycosylase 2 family protein [Staphylococcus marylandisciuri]